MVGTVEEVVDRMVGFLEERGQLPQEYAVHRIVAEVDEELTYINKNRNRAIGQDVLDAFRERTGSKVVWSRGGRYWRWRRDSDAEGSRQVP